MPKAKKNKTKKPFPVMRRDITGSQTRDKGKQVKIKLNGKTVAAHDRETIKQVAGRKKVFLPGLCNHPDFPIKGNCRLCVVDVKGWNKLTTACTTLVTDGMEIDTETSKVKKARNVNLEFIFAEHIEKCANCIWRFECKLLKNAERYKLLITTFPDRKGKRKIHKFANAVEVDGSQCIDCRNCVDACTLLQKIDYLEIDGKGSEQEILPSKSKKKHCILCGQCALHCPVSSAQEQAHWDTVEKIVKEKKEAGKVVVAQFAPSIRVAIGEDFGVKHGEIVTGQIVTGLKKLGFDYVFDVNFAADLTTIVEAEELLDRVKNKGVMPMITSCCPGWINYAEFYHPQLLPNITTARSPQIHNGGAIKTYWADKMKIKPRDIVVVSIMPCTAKKYEATRKEMKIGDNFPVDYVLTTRELSFMLKKHSLDLAKLKGTKADNPLGSYSGAAAIFGGTGGVMESALRTAHYYACGSKNSDVCRERIEFREARGLEGVKEATVEVAGMPVRIAVVNGIGNIKPVINNLKNYDYIEVMACPGGCIGGGGQPIPTTWEIRKKRLAALYKHDRNLKMRKSYENKGVLKVLDWLKKKGHALEHSVLHTKYKKRKNYK